MKLTKQIVNESIKCVQMYAKANYGQPNGPDFIEFARLVNESEQAGMSAFVHIMTTVLCSSEFKDRMKEVKGPADPNDKDAAMEGMLHTLQGTQSFNAFIEVLYLGYKLGRTETELEQLENLAKE